MKLFPLFIEQLAVVSSLMYVGLAAKENRWCWMFGGIGSALYVYINFSYALYFDTLLQLYYVGVSVYGWMFWSALPSNESAAIRRIDKMQLVWLMGVATVITLFLGQFGKKYLSQESFSFLDAGVTVFSLLATWMTARKYLENWLLWIAIDAAAAYMYYLKSLLATSMLYVAFCALAVYGFYSWKQRLVEREN
jgi:nicotinamide mononucleotide transporter